ncbi:MAG TPA: hypothetical protein VEH04_00480 [Verrucomicrobiae bacterium]|nr:hypothetical protein [Verrucomicrobiae bacterium]
MIRWLFKWCFRLAIIFVVLVVLFFAFKDSIWTMVLENRIRNETGMEARIGKLSTGIVSSTVTIEDLKLYNTAEFGGTLFLRIPELHVEVDPVAVAQRRLRLKLVRFNLGEINIVRNEAGKTNLLLFVSDTDKRTGRRKAGAAEQLLGDLEFDGIDVLNLSLGKARFIDLADQTRNSEIAVGMENQVFKDVKSEGDAYAILFMIWLRSGGKLSISPNTIAKDYFERQIKDIETSVRTQVQTLPRSQP